MRLNASSFVSAGVIESGANKWALSSYKLKVEPGMLTHTLSRSLSLSLYVSLKNTHGSLNRHQTGTQ